MKRKNAKIIQSEEKVAEKQTAPKPQKSKEELAALRKQMMKPKLKTAQTTPSEPS